MLPYKGKMLEACSSTVVRSFLVMGSCMVSPIFCDSGTGVVGCVVDDEDCTTL